MVMHWWIENFPRIHFSLALGLFLYIISVMFTINQLDRILNHLGDKHLDIPGLRVLSWQHHPYAENVIF